VVKVRSGINEERFLGSSKNVWIDCVIGEEKEIEKTCSRICKVQK
jgi:hypothetical protein